MWRCAFSIVLDWSSYTARNLRGEERRREHRLWYARLLYLCMFEQKPKLKHNDGPAQFTNINLIFWLAIKLTTIEQNVIKQLGSYIVSLPLHVLPACRFLFVFNVCHTLSHDYSYCVYVYDECLMTFNSSTKCSPCMQACLHAQPNICNIMLINIRIIKAMNQGGFVVSEYFDVVVDALKWIS